MGEGLKQPTDQMKRAINSYMRGRSKKQALLDAGYSDWVASTDAHSVFDRPEIVAEIQKRQKAAAKRAAVDTDWLINYAMDVLNVSSTDALVEDPDRPGTYIVNLEKLSPELKRILPISISSSGGRGNVRPVASVRIDDNVRVKWFEQLCKLTGSYPDQKVNVSGEVDLIERLHAGRARIAGDGEGTE